MPGSATPTLCDSMLTVGEAAHHLKITPARVRQLLHTGALRGRKSGGIWLVDTHSVSDRMRTQPAAATRPLGAHMLQLLVGAFNDGGPQHRDKPDRTTAATSRRLQRHLARLDESPNPAALLRYWVGSHERMLRKRYLGNVGELWNDPRVCPTGFSVGRSGLAAGPAVDVRVAGDVVTDLVADYLLIDDPQPNVYVHASAGVDLDTGLGTLLIDLAAHAGPREDDAVYRLLHGG